MKKRLLSAIALLALVLLVGSSPAAAQKPIPSIKTTAPYKALKSYVNLLQTKRTIPTSAAQKSAYRSKLASKRLKANTKAKNLYAQRLNRLSKQDDNKQRRDIKRIRQNQKQQVSALKVNQASKVAKLQAKEDVAIDKVNNRYAGRINALADKRAKYQKQLDKAKSPSKRAALTKKINATQKQINALNDAKQDDINVIASKYNGRIDSVNDLYAAKIAKVKAAAQRQIKQANNAWKSLFREQVADAKERRTDEIGLITDLRDRGAGYIDQMPPIGE